ncbi:MAG: hypothetical protein HY332_21765 [Chloroflexi bacterium]|nr:hypothetical protein [Chloroflexota bacterium]
MAKRVTKGNLWGYIQSRPYASVADIRRLFMMDVEDAAIVPTSEGNYYIGLPQPAADLVRQLWQEGRIILDVNPDLKARVVQGIYAAHAPQGRQPAASGAATALKDASAFSTSSATPAGTTKAAKAKPPTPHRQAVPALGLPAAEGGSVEPPAKAESNKRRRRRWRRAASAPDAAGGAPAGEAVRDGPADTAAPVAAGASESSS